MSTPFLIVTRFSELVLIGKIDNASAYLDDGVILQSWQGVIEGKADVLNYLNDGRRFMHLRRSFGPWRQVLRSMENEVDTFLQKDGMESASAHKSSSFDHDRHRPLRSCNSLLSDRRNERENENCYDGQGYVIFERLGTMTTRPRFSVKTVKVRESIALRNNLVVLIILSKQEANRSILMGESCRKISIDWLRKEMKEERKNLEMKITEAERVRELEILVHTLEQELDTLKKNKENFQSQLTIVTGSSTRADLLVQFPCYEYCGRRPRKKFRDVPIEQVCNLVQQFDVATNSVRDQNALDSKCITELKNYIREQELGERTWRKKINELKDKTGVDLALCQASQREHLLSLQSYEGEAYMEEAAARRKLLRKEIQAANALIKAKGKTILIGKETAESVGAFQCEIKQLINDIRVARRDIEVETNALEDERELESDVQCSIEERTSVENSNRMLIEQVEQLVQSLSEEREVMRLEKYAPQERLLKAQDYRLRQLEKRRKATEICLRHHCSIRAVNAILESKWEAAPVETLDGRDDLLDVDRVIPEDEKIHPALHNLFLREKERLAQAICKMNIVVAEKESVMASQACKLEALSRACNYSIQELDDTANKTAFEQEALRREAQQWAHQQRALYYELVREKNKLSASI